MRIYFRSLTLPKKASKRVQAEFTSEFIQEVYPERAMKLSEAHNITARMLGYDSWHELKQVTERSHHAPSLLDEEVDENEQTARIDYQAEVLGTVSPLIEPLVREKALRIRVSSAAPSSTKLSEQFMHRNTLKYCVDSFTDEGEWRFFPSFRSAEVSEDIWELREKWKRGQSNFGQYKEALDSILSQQPENINAICDQLGAALDMDCLAFVNNLLPRYEQVVRDCIPTDFPTRKKTTLSWWTIENRDFLRVVCQLAECYYRLGDFKKAKYWLNLSNRTSDQFVDYLAPYTKDLKLKPPTGRVASMHDYELEILMNGNEEEIAELYEHD